MLDYFVITDWQPLIRVSDQAYPLYMPYVRSSTPNTSFPIPIRDYILEPFGYAPVYDTPFPAGDVVTEGNPELKEDGKWYRTWNIRPFTEEEIAANLVVAKQTLIDQAVSLLATDTYKGIPYTFKGKTYQVEVVGDRLTTLVCVKSLVKEAEDNEIFQYSFLDETIVDFTKEEFLAMWTAVMNTLYSATKSQWAFREIIKATEDIKNLPVLPETFIS